jgi:hypothetical protein
MTRLNINCFCPEVDEITNHSNTRYSRDNSSLEVHSVSSLKFENGKLELQIEVCTKCHRQDVEDFVEILTKEELIGMTSLR